MRIITLTILYYGGALFGLLNPVFGLLFFIHIVIFRPESLVWGNPIFGRLHLFTAIIVVIGCFIHRRTLRMQSDDLYQKKNLVIFALFVIWLLVVSILAEVSVQLSLDKTLELLKIFAVCIVFWKLINTEKRMDLYVWVTVISFGLMSFWGYLQTLVGNERLDTLWPGGSNYIAAQLALMAPLAIAKVLDKNSSVSARLVFLGCASSMVLGAFGTQSRGSLLGLGVGMFAFLINTKYRARALLAAALLAFLVYPWILERSYTRLATTFAPEEERDLSAESRFVLWKIGLRIWEDYPIAGVGLENFSPVKEKYADKVGDIVPTQEMYDLIFNQQRYPHGVYTGMLAETGLVGVSLFLILLLRSLLVRFPRSFSRAAPHMGLYLQAKGAQAGLLGFAIASFFYDIQYIEMLYFQLFFVGAIKVYSDSLAVAATVPAKSPLVLSPA